MNLLQKAIKAASRAKLEKADEFTHKALETVQIGEGFVAATNRSVAIVIEGDWPVEKTLWDEKAPNIRKLFPDIETLVDGYHVAFFSPKAVLEACEKLKASRAATVRFHKRKTEDTGVVPVLFGAKSNDVIPVVVDLLGDSPTATVQVEFLKAVAEAAIDWNADLDYFIFWNRTELIYTDGESFKAMIATIRVEPEKA